MTVNLGWQSWHIFNVTLNYVSPFRLANQIYCDCISATEGDWRTGLTPPSQLHKLMYICSTKLLCTIIFQRNNLSIDPVIKFCRVIMNMVTDTIFAVWWHPGHSVAVATHQIWGTAGTRTRVLCRTSTNFIFFQLTSESHLTVSIPANPSPRSVPIGLFIKPIFLTTLPRKTPKHIANFRRN